MAQSSSVYEIELKALLSQEQYDLLRAELPKKMKLLNKETLHTRKFKTPAKEDIRLRYSENKFELVHKDGHATDTARKEVTIKLASKQELDNFATLLKTLNFLEEPSWITYRMDFEYSYDNNIYSVSLQHTENFAQILEVEFAAISKEETEFHEKRIREIISALGCEPIENKDFSERIKKYIEDNNAK